MMESENREEQEGRRNRKGHKARVSRIRRALGVLGICAGIGLFFYPEIRTQYLNMQTERTMRAFQETDACEEEEEREGAQRVSDPQESSEGRQASTVQAAAASGAREWQAGDCLGCIEIPAMDVKLPLYYGTSAESLAKGAGVLEGSSLPYGGAGTNCVIAGHRGYQGAPYFREIEVLQKGDLVYITNEVETLTYAVDGIQIIEPTDREAVAIQEGRDMITLLTCHPYRSHGRYRYLVYCERVEEGAESTAEVSDSAVGNTLNPGESDEAESAWIVPESSVWDIRRETWFRRGCGVGIVLMILAMLGRRKKNEE